MNNNKKPECGAILFHSTTKKNLKNIMKNGIRPGAGKGWCELGEKAGLIVTKDMKKECEENIFMSGNMERLERQDLQEIGVDTVAVVCVPQEKIYIDNKPFKKWDIDRFTQVPFAEQKLSEFGEIKVRGIIPPENIIGCLDIKKYTIWQNRGIYIINKNCD